MPLDTPVESLAPTVVGIEDRERVSAAEGFPMSSISQVARLEVERPTGKHKVCA